MPINYSVVRQKYRPISNLHNGELEEKNEALSIYA